LFAGWAFPRRRNVLPTTVVAAGTQPLAVALSGQFSA
jgi:hypothetical protein